MVNLLSFDPLFAYQSQISEYSVYHWLLGHMIEPDVITTYMILAHEYC